jgi:hypothetical protein
MQPLIIYHANCSDGFCAAYFFWLAYPGAEFLAMTHGQVPPDVTGREVYILDFSFKRDLLREMSDKASRVILLDHHKTAYEDLTGFAHSNAEIIFDMKRSGGRLAWDYLYQQQRLPKDLQDKYSTSDPHALVAYTEDRDLWRWSLPHSREINANIRSYPMNFTEWSRLAAVSVKEPSFIAEGAAILRDDARKVEIHVPHAQEIKLLGHRGFAVNATLLQSEIAHELGKRAAFGACYVARPDGSWVWSLRSEASGADVSMLAKHFGGGGHQHAAGFEVDDATNREILKAGAEGEQG